ncbi:hypothetical protein [Streptomyces sp. NPDC005485]|uniref:hypothetical protein n=1 Tax=Streptomyces sp. NPDC005485 TaxID=3155591 RepID=UPI0033A2C561
MRMRRALVGLVVGSALALGGTAATAQASEPTRSIKASARETNADPAGWHYYGAYWNKSDCISDGDASGDTYQCGAGPFGQWLLYLWY